MAVVSTYSTEATNHKSVTNTKNPSTATEGCLYSSSGYVSVAAADDDTSKYFVLPVHSSWSIKSILIANDAITAGTSYDLGLYTTAATPVVVDVDAYGTAIDMSSARTTAPFNGAFEARDIINLNKKVWEDAAATAETNSWYWLTLTANTVGSAAGDIAVQVIYTT
jgi:hypothetical protein